jgi:hypothetical protein
MPIASEAGKERLRSQRTYDFTIAGDGSFRIEDVPAGTYVLRFRVPTRPPRFDPTRPNPNQIPRPQELGTLGREIVVSELTGGRSDEPLDIGSLVLTVRSS